MSMRGRTSRREVASSSFERNDRRYGLHDDQVAEYRRLKRIDARRGWEENGGGVYRNTPSPVKDVPSASSDSILTEDEEELEHELEEVKRQQRAKEHGAGQRQAAAKVFEEDAVLQELEREEIELLRLYIRQIEEELKADLERQKLEEDENAMVGPEPLYTYESSGLGVSTEYGQNLRPGEGTAMAAYVQQGQRIPRRGEVGLDATEIDQFERAGYVMSGNRNAKMNAIRMRKENQVYSAEEKAALAMLNFEEQKKKEAQIIDDMKRLVEKTVNDVAK